MLRKTGLSAISLSTLFIRQAWATDWNYDAQGSQTVVLPGGYGAVADSSGTFYNDGAGSQTYDVILDSGSSGFLMSNNVQQAFNVPLTGQTYDDVGIGGTETFSVTAPTQALFAPINTVDPDSHPEAFSSYGTFKFQARQQDPLGGSIFFDIIGTPVLHKQVTQVLPRIISDQIGQGFVVNIARTNLMNSLPALPAQGTYHIPLSFQNFVAGTPAPSEDKNPLIMNVSAAAPGHSLVTSNWLFDSGASLNIVSSTLAQSLGIDTNSAPEFTVQGLGVGDQIITYSGYRLDVLDIPLSDGNTLIFHGTVVFVPDSNNLPPDLPGVLGMPLFMQSTDQVDQNNGEATSPNQSIFDKWYLDGPGNQVVLIDSTSSYTVDGTPTWAQNGGGSWLIASNWSNYVVPDGAGAAANFGIATTGPLNVTLDGTHTLGQMVFNSSNSYTISTGDVASNHLVLDAGAGTALISVLNGSHAISAPISLNSNTLVAITSTTGTLTISGSISGIGALSESGAGTLVLAASNTYLGTTTINSGTMILAADNAIPTGSSVNNSGTLQVNASNAISQISGSGAMFIGAAGRMTLSGGTTSTQTALTIAAGGKLTLNNTHNILKLNYGSGASPNAAIRKYLQNGYNAGHWDAGGPLINASVGAVTSTTAGASGNVFSIGYADGADNAAIGVLPGQMQIKYTYAGDANLDGQVNLSDLIILANDFGSTGAQWDQGEFSYDGTVNLTDLIMLGNNFGAGVGSPVEQAITHSQFQSDLASVEANNPNFAAALGAAVPEPASLGLLSFGTLGLLHRRKRRVN